MSGPALPADHPSPLLGPLSTNRTAGMRMLAFVDATRVAPIIQTRMNSRTKTGPDGEKRLAGQRPGPKAQTTVRLLLLSWLLCADGWHNYRRSELMRVVVGLDEDVAREVGLVDAKGNRRVPPYKDFLRQLLRMEKVLREGWTVVEHEGQPNEKRVRYDMDWFVRTLIKASVPKRALEQVRHVALDSTAVHSWGTYRRGYGDSDLEKDPLAARRRKVEETDNDDLPEPDLAKARRVAKRSKNKKRRNVPYGPDDRPVYSLDEDVRVGWSSGNAETPKGPLLGFDLHLAVAALTVPVRCKIGSKKFREMTQFIVGMKLMPGMSEYGPSGAQAVLEAKKICPNITDATADRGYTPLRETFTRVLHKFGINVFMDYKKAVVAAWDKRTIGKRKQDAYSNAGTLLTPDTPEHMRTLPEALKGTGKEAKWYEDRFRRWGWSAKGRPYRNGQLQLRDAAAAGRVSNAPATAASGPRSGPYVGPRNSRATIVPELEDTDQWQRLPFGTRAWKTAYQGARSTVESVNSQLRDRKGLAHGGCRAFGLAANTMRALAVVVSHNLKKAAQWQAGRNNAADNSADDSTEDGQSASQTDPDGPQEPTPPPRAPP